MQRTTHPLRPNSPRTEDRPDSPTLLPTAETPKQDIGTLTADELASLSTPAAAAASVTTFASAAPSHQAVVSALSPAAAAAIGDTNDRATVTDTYNSDANDATYVAMPPPVSSAAQQPDELSLTRQSDRPPTRTAPTPDVQKPAAMNGDGVNSGDESDDKNVDDDEVASAPRHPDGSVAQLSTPATVYPRGLVLGAGPAFIGSNLLSPPQRDTRSWWERQPFWSRVILGLAVGVAGGLLLAGAAVGLAFTSWVALPITLGGLTALALAKTIAVIMASGMAVGAVAGTAVGAAAGGVASYTYNSKSDVAVVPQPAARPSSSASIFCCFRRQRAQAGEAAPLLGASAVPAAQAATPANEAFSRASFGWRALVGSVLSSGCGAMFSCAKRRQTQTSIINDTSVDAAAARPASPGH